MYGHYSWFGQLCVVLSILWTPSLLSFPNSLSSKMSPMMSPNSFQHHAAPIFVGHGGHPREISGKTSQLRIAGFPSRFHIPRQTTEASNFLSMVPFVSTQAEAYKNMSRITQSGHRRTVTAAKELSHRPVNAWNFGFDPWEAPAWACRSAPVPHPHANETKDSHDLSRTFWHHKVTVRDARQDCVSFISWSCEIRTFNVQWIYILNHSDIFPTSIRRECN